MAAKKSAVTASKKKPAPKHSRTQKSKVSKASAKAKAKASESAAERAAKRAPKVTPEMKR